jgi:predicted PurR-regulated permease PerM
VGSAIEWGKALGGQLLHRLLLFFIALLALFVLLRHGAWIGGRVLEAADRLLGDPGERLASKMVDGVRGTVTGTVVVGVAEGLLIGMADVMAGVPNPVLYTLLTIGFAMIPLGAWLAFSAAALLLVLKGDRGLAAAGVVVWGATVMLVGDHFVWPTLVGGAARLPFLLALVGIFGGLQSFGLIGLFLGPVIMAALMTIWREWLMNRGGA